MFQSKIDEIISLALSNDTKTIKRIQDEIDYILEQSIDFTDFYLKDDKFIPQFTFHDLITDSILQIAEDETSFIVPTNIDHIAINVLEKVIGSTSRTKRNTKFLDHYNDKINQIISTLG